MPQPFGPHPPAMVLTAILEVIANIIVDAIALLIPNRVKQSRWYTALFIGAGLLLLGAAIWLVMAHSGTA